ncbi:Polyketide cyclase / dehydrase and lipid transport [Aquimixticola soesokkakensis]|uniref:Polyketide cyclase / dehydrase and lipid transport n=1 Tax=Aquimixticola soesokkakensis TaxID=1519096 RepID=A0A1Y5SV16_9RHOB|nr:SRPBCC family protein [Aquimixticola soesokkakensis]SLN47663.1 Polyketide cyclase / dehydrase and lipid transport [Aquimixticola soesokkakensis]
MKFSTRQDIEAPIDYVFGQITDFSAFERQALRRGIRVKRKQDTLVAAVGLAWSIRASFRGAVREVETEVATYDPPNAFSLTFHSAGLSGVLEVDVVALSRTSTRVTVGLDVRPQTLSARLLLQSVKLAKSSVQKRFDTRISDLAATVEERYSTVA